MSTGYKSEDPKRDMADKTTGEILNDSVMGTDREMGEVHPGAPAAWVFGTYPAVLLIVGIIAVVSYLIIPADKPSDVDSNKAKSTNQPIDTKIKTSSESDLKTNL